MTGRTPYLARLTTPHPRLVSSVKRGSRSLSPQVLARVSPFSQAVNSRSWSTFYSEEFSFGRHFEPILPQLCLSWVWSHDGGPSHKAALYRTTDFSGGQYLIISLEPLGELWLIDYHTGKGEPLSFGPLTTLPAGKAVPLGEEPMFLTLDGTGQISLYSGTHKVPD